MAFDPTKAPASQTPTLDELDGGIAYFSDGSTLTFPPATKFKAENWGEKLGMRIFPPVADGQLATDIGNSFCVIKGATKSTIEVAVKRCGG